MDHFKFTVSLALLAVFSITHHLWLWNLTPNKGVKPLLPIERAWLHFLIDQCSRNGIYLPKEYVARQQS